MSESLPAVGESTVCVCVCGGGGGGGLPAIEILFIPSAGQRAMQPWRP